MTRPTNDPVTERARRLAKRLQKREAFQQPTKEIRADRLFSKVIRRVATISLPVQQNSHPDEGSSLSSLRDAESILKALAIEEGDSEPFLSFDSYSEGKYSAHSNYRSTHDTLDGPEDKESDTLPTSEPQLPELEVPDRQRADQHPTPKEEEGRPPTPEEEEDKRPPKEEEERPATPPTHVPTPDDDMSFQYPRYRDDPDAESHVHAFQQTWETKHVSQCLNVAEEERSKMAEFGMTLEGHIARSIFRGPWPHVKPCGKSFCYSFTDRWCRGSSSDNFIQHIRNPMRQSHNLPSDFRHCIVSLQGHPRRMKQRQYFWLHFVSLSGQCSKYWASIPTP